MPHRRTRAHDDQLSEFERGRIIGLKEGVFSNESRFHLCPDDHQKRVWRRPGQCADPAFTIASHTGPQPGVMDWDATSFDSRTPLVVIRAFQRLPWSARSPDPSPIKQFWDMMESLLHLPGNVYDFSRQLEQIWQEIPQEIIKVTAATLTGHQDLSEFERGVIIGARERGHRISEIAMKFGFSCMTTSRIYREYRESGKTSNLRHRCGRKKIMQERDQQRLTRIIKRDRRAKGWRF
ncbi:transposable element Tc1 transposase [Trichonephila clavipes]|nr:transposable element Tc1 transposase [Trichonephila clavipes]